MFDLLRAIGNWLRHFIVSVPIYVAAPAMIVIGALDSSLLSLPEINDYLVITRCYKDPSAVFIFPLFAAAGSVLGCLLLYTIVRRGGQAVLRRRFQPDRIEQVEHAYARYGFLTLAVPALLPPPMPFKIFVATAGALEYPRWRFILTIMIARSLRYYVEGILAVYYGRRVLEYIKDNGLVILSATGALCLVGLVVYQLWSRFRSSRAPDAIMAAAAPLAVMPHESNAVETTPTTNANTITTTTTSTNTTVSSEPSLP